MGEEDLQTPVLEGAVDPACLLGLVLMEYQAISAMTDGISFLQRRFLGATDQNVPVTIPHYRHKNVTNGV